MLLEFSMAIVFKSSTLVCPIRIQGGTLAIIQFGIF